MLNSQVYLELQIVGSLAQMLQLLGCRTGQKLPETIKVV